MMGYDAPMSFLCNKYCSKKNHYELKAPRIGKLKKQFVFLHLVSETFYVLRRILYRSLPIGKRVPFGRRVAGLGPVMPTELRNQPRWIITR